MVEQGQLLGEVPGMLDTLQALLKDTEETIMLSRNAVRGRVAYLVGIFGKDNVLNSVHPVKNKTLLDAKTKICEFMSKLQHYSKVRRRQDFSSFA